MAAITKVWTPPVASQQDPAVPITTTWGNNVKDNEQFVMEWLGADYLAGAVQNHNHDGVNSAVVNIFSGLMPNGGFDEVSGGLPIGWTATEFTGGTVASSAAVNKHGDQVVAITSTVLANGGGSLIQDKYKPVTDNKRYGVEIYRWASVANVSCRAELVWYDVAKVQISTTVLFADTNTATAASLYSNTVTSPANARFVRTKITGGVPGSGSAVGTVYFDGGRVDETLPANVVDLSAMGPASVGTFELIDSNVTLSKMAADSVNAQQLIASSVHTSELYTLTASVTSTTGGITFTMTGGNYCFMPRHRTNNSSYGAFLYGNYTTGGGQTVDTYGTSYLTRMTLDVASGGTAYEQHDYVAASPPHDMGDGDIPAFIYAVIDNAAGSVESIAFAAEPVWLANGPTNAMPDYWRMDEVSGKRKKYKLEKDIPAGFNNLPPVERAIAIAELPDVEVEITDAVTHADMDLIPHPFQGNDLTGKTVVMLDPVCNCVRTLAELDRAGEDVHEIIRNKYITIGNAPLNRVTPAGLLIPETAWKKSKKR